MKELKIFLRITKIVLLRLLGMLSFKIKIDALGHLFLLRQF